MKGHTDSAGLAKHHPLKPTSTILAPSAVARDPSSKLVKEDGSKGMAKSHALNRTSTITPTVHDTSEAPSKTKYAQQEKSQAFGKTSPITNPASRGDIQTGVRPSAMNDLRRSDVSKFGAKA